MVASLRALELTFPFCFCIQFSLLLRALLHFELWAAHMSIYVHASLSLEQSHLKAKHLL